MQDRLTWTRSALARILRPAVRLALAMGLKHAQLEEILRELLLDEARYLWRDEGVAEPNLSQLSVTTGLNRKDVTVRVRQVREPLAGTEGSAAARAFTAWLQLAADDPARRRLPVADAGDGPSFELLARLATRGNLHHRTLLDELQRLGLVTVPTGQPDGEVELASDGFVPAASLRDMLAFTGANVGDHLSAAVANTLRQPPRMLERSVYAAGLTEEDCTRIHQLARRQWDAVHHRLVGEMSRAYAAADGRGTSRMRVGIYVYQEDITPGASERHEEQT